MALNSLFCADVPLSNYSLTAGLISTVLCLLTFISFPYFIPVFRFVYILRCHSPPVGGAVKILVD